MKHVEWFMWSYFTRNYLGINYLDIFGDDASEEEIDARGMNGMYPICKALLSSFCKQPADDVLSKIKPHVHLQYRESWPEVAPALLVIAQSFRKGAQAATRWPPAFLENL